MNKFTKIMLGVGGAVQVATTTTVAVRYASLKKAMRNGVVEGWVREVVGTDMKVVFDDSIVGVAKLAEDKSTIFIRLAESDFFELAMNWTVSVKTIIQTAAAHEMGHYVDPRLEEFEDMIQAAIQAVDYEAYCAAMLERETRAWQFGKRFAPNKRFYNSVNINNLRKYKQRLNEDEVRFQLAESSIRLYNATRFFN